MATEWDENEFLEDLKSYMETELSGIDSSITVHVVDTLDLSDLTYEKLEPPFVAIKDGNAVNVKNNGCEIDYTMPMLEVVKRVDDKGGAVYGRAPKTTYFGIVQLNQYLIRILQTALLIDPDNFDMTNQYIDSVVWASADASQPYRGAEVGRNVYWQSKQLNVNFILRRK